MEKRIVSSVVLIGIVFVSGCVGTTTPSEGELEGEWVDSWVKCQDMELTLPEYCRLPSNDSVKVSEYLVGGCSNVDQWNSLGCNHTYGIEVCDICKKCYYYNYSEHASALSVVTFNVHECENGTCDDHYNITIYPTPRNKTFIDCGDYLVSVNYDEGRVGSYLTDDKNEACRVLWEFTAIISNNPKPRPECCGWCPKDEK